jgi:hypothetical protein
MKLDSVEKEILEFVTIVNITHKNVCSLCSLPRTYAWSMLCTYSSTALKVELMR